MSAALGGWLLIGMGEKEPWLGSSDLNGWIVWRRLFLLSLGFGSVHVARRSSPSWTLLEVLFFSIRISSFPSPPSSLSVCNSEFHISLSK